MKHVVRSDDIDLTVVSRPPDVLGEGPVYDAENARLLWVDIVGGCVRELIWDASGRWSIGRTWAMDDETSAVQPRRGGGLVVLVGTEVVAVSEDGERQALGSLEQVVDDLDRRVVRFNDAKCDRAGCLIAGWLALDRSRPGGLVRVEGDGSIEPLLEDVGVANGMGWSPDGDTYYLVDSMTLGVDAFDYDHAAGRLANRRPVVTIERGIGAPDGLAVDDEACLWVAVPYSGQVRRYSPEGELLGAVYAPTPKVFSCAFGGPSGEELFVTSGSVKPPVDLDSDSSNPFDIERERIIAAYEDEVGGALFVCRPGVSGPSATPFSG